MLAWMRKLLRGPEAPPPGPEDHIQLVALVNSQRFAAGSPLLHRHPALDARAREAGHGLALESRPCRSIGGTPEGGTARHGYPALTAHRLEATGQADSFAAVLEWLNNPATGSALTSSVYLDCGAAVTADAAGRRVCVLVLARRRNGVETSK